MSIPQILLTISILRHFGRKPTPLAFEGYRTAQNLHINLNNNNLKPFYEYNMARLKNQASQILLHTPVKTKAINAQYYAIEGRKSENGLRIYIFRRQKSFLQLLVNAPQRIGDQKRHRITRTSSTAIHS